MQSNDLEERYERPPELSQRKAKLKEWTSNAIELPKERCKIVDLQNGESSVRYRYGLNVSPEAGPEPKSRKRLPNASFSVTPRVTTLEEKGRHIISALLDKFLTDEGEKLLPLDFRELIKAKKFGSKERLVTDFIAGMTDRYAYG
jgi:dGTP triphosphohydrolase